jgi:hypothetical protein
LCAWKRRIRIFSREDGRTCTARHPTPNTLKGWVTWKTQDFSHETSAFCFWSGRFTFPPNMTPAQESKLVGLGCLLMFVMTVAFGMLAYFVNGYFLVPIAVLIAGWLLIVSTHSNEDKQRLLAAFDQAFDEFQGTKPTLEIGANYGYRSFTVTFMSKGELAEARASGCLGAFKGSIQDLYGHTGSRSRPFDAGTALHATYQGWREEYLESLKTNPVD